MRSRRVNVWPTEAMVLSELFIPIVTQFFRLTLIYTLSIRRKGEIGKLEYSAVV